MAQIWRCGSSGNPGIVLGDCCETQNLPREWSCFGHSVVNDGVLRTNRLIYLAGNNFRNLGRQIRHLNNRRLHQNALFLGPDDHRPSNHHLHLLPHPPKPRIRSLPQITHRPHIRWPQRRSRSFPCNDDHCRPLLPHPISSTRYSLHVGHGDNDCVSEWVDV